MSTHITFTSILSIFRRFLLVMASNTVLCTKSYDLRARSDADVFRRFCAKIDKTIQIKYSTLFDKNQVVYKVILTFSQTFFARAGKRLPRRKPFPSQGRRHEVTNEAETQLISACPTRPLAADKRTPRRIIGEISKISLKFPARYDRLYLENSANAVKTKRNAL